MSNDSLEPCLTAASLPSPIEASPSTTGNGDDGLDDLALEPALTMLTVLATDPVTPHATGPATHSPEAAAVPSLPWETLDALINGVSTIDLSAIPLNDEAEAIHFVGCYGYNWHDPSDRHELERLFDESVAFIETRLLDPLEEASLREMALSIPVAFKEGKDVVALLLAASTQRPDQNTHLQHWACAILKVMHTLVHIDNAALFQYAGAAREQILRQFRTVLSHHPDTGQVLLGHPNDPRQLPLHGVEIKQMKSRESLLIKLLSKKANMADEMDDLLGLRLITEKPVDVLAALAILQAHHVITFSNINPNRSRNSLLDVDQVRAYLANLESFGQFAQWQDLVAALRTFSVAPPEASFQDHNPVSSLGYRSLHITCRHVLKVSNPVFGADHGMRRVFFPYEIQLVDRENYQTHQAGDSAHAAYKQRQLSRARTRVLGALLPRHYRQTTEKLVRPLSTSLEVLGGGPSPT